MSPQSRRDFLRYAALLSSTAIAPASIAMVADDVLRPNSAKQMYNVTNYGAFPDGSDATAGFQRAIGAAQSAGGGTIVIPPGTFVFKSQTVFPYGASIRIHGKVPVTMIGSGWDKTFLLQQVPSQTLISVQADYTQIHGVTLDCLTYDGGQCLGVQANNTLLESARALGSKAI